MYLPNWENGGSLESIKYVKNRDDEINEYG